MYIIIRTWQHIQSLYYPTSCTVLAMSLCGNLPGFFPNQKPWMTRQVRMLLKAHNTAFRSGDRRLHSAAQANLKRGIKDAKTDYKGMTEDTLSSNSPRQMWQGIQNITNHRGCDVTTGDSLHVAGKGAELLLCLLWYTTTSHNCTTSPWHKHPPTWNQPLSFLYRRNLPQTDSTIIAQ